MTDKLPAPTRESDSIQVENFNGINLVATKLNIPFEQSPHILNCSLDPGGKMRGRGGTALSAIDITPNTNAIQEFDYTSPDGYNWTLKKLGRELWIYQLIGADEVAYANGGVNPLVITAAPVWSAAAAGVEVTMCATAITNAPRVFFASGVDTIKQVTYNLSTQLFAASNFVPTGAPANWTGTNHPRAITLWDGRLYAAGTPNGPAQCWASKAANLDNFTPGTGADDGFAFELYDTKEQRIIDIRPYTQALVIFTRSGVFVHAAATFVSGAGSSAGVVTPTNQKRTKISDIGAISAQTITPVEKTIHYLSDTGVYEFIEGVSSGTPYQSGEVTTMIQPLFQDIATAALETSSACYDPSRREYWLAIPGEDSEVANRLFVYKIIRKAWTEYDLGVYASRTKIRNLAKLTDTTGFSRVSMSIENEAGTAFWTVTWNWDRLGKYADLIKTFAGNGVTKVFTYPFNNLLAPVYTYTVPTPTTNLLSTDFKFSPASSVNDIVVKVNAVPTTNYVKLGDNRIQLITTPVPGDIVTVSYIDPDHVAVKVDNVRLSSTFWSISGNDLIFTTAPVDKSVIDVGITYPSEFDTYELNFGSIRNLKRLRNIYVYAENIEDKSTYSASDVNTLSGQNPADIVAQPKTLGHLDVLYWPDGRQVDTQVVLDVYYNPAGVWNTALWDQTYPSGFDSEVITIPLEGLVNYVTFRFRSKYDGTFSLPGYSLDIHHKGRRV